MALSDIGAGGKTPPSPSPATQRESLATKLSGWVARLRNRIYQSQSFQQFAVRFPLTQGVSNAYAKRLFNLAVGFSYARVLHACVGIDLFAMLSEGPMDDLQIAERAGLTQRGAHTLLEAAVALELIERHGQKRYRLAALGAALLGNPGVEAMIQHHSLLYEDLRDPLALLNGEVDNAHVKTFWDYRPEADHEQAGAYSRLMAATQAMIARVVLAAYPIARHRIVMDIGGGEGVFLQHAARAAPKLRVRLVDLPPVAQRAQSRFIAQALSDRAECFGLDARRDVLPAGADLATFVRVLHDHDDDAALALLRAAHAALAPGAAVLIAEPMAGTKGAEPMGAAYFGLYLTAMGQGKPRSKQALAAMLQKAGFTAVREISSAQPVLVRLLVARKTPVARQDALTTESVQLS
jgi:demethylspheroidene O-methyltransferase